MAGGPRRPLAGGAGWARGAPGACPTRDGAAAATLEGRSLRPAARTEPSGAEGASARCLGLAQRSRWRGLSSGGARCRPPMAERQAVLCCRGPGAAGAAPGERRRALPRSLCGGCPRAGGGAGAAELQRLPRAAAAAAGGGGRAAAEAAPRRAQPCEQRALDIAGMTRLLSASVLVALPSTQTDGAASLSSKTQRWPGEWRAQGAPGRILLMAQGTQEIFFPSSPTETFSVQSPLSARSLEKLEKSPRDIFHPEIQKGREGLSYPGRQTQRCPRRYRDCKNHKKQLGLQRKQTGENKRSHGRRESAAGEEETVLSLCSTELCHCCVISCVCTESSHLHL
uniref:uncharacterized protein LOC129117402 isoform X2 n=1 Tax=Agelaius phoeniceus TaxID=39638 RepID=UPI0023EAAADB|nr:uncharacterized protein LOC129117402 isoform X2 [Agelaius phoeniceus]